MHNGLIKRKQFSNAEFFFTQKLLELFNYATLDTYRVKYNNPKTIIEEFCQVLTDWHKNKIKDFKTVTSVSDELSRLIKKDKNLKFIRISKNSFLQICITSKEENYMQAYYASKVLLSENVNYIEGLYLDILRIINELNSSVQFELDKLEDLNDLIGYLASELHGNGYSKAYLFHISWSLFGKFTNHTFVESFEMLKTITLNKKMEAFKVYLRVKFSNTEPQILKLKIFEFLNEEEIKLLHDKSKDFRKFYNDRRKDFPDTLCFDVKSLDYYNATKLAKAKVSEILDIYKIGYSNRSLRIFTQALLVSESNPDKFELQGTFYQIEGKVEKSEELYEKFLTRYLSVRGNDKIALETKEKIKSAIRYFRLGTEAVELEQKFINYWIGIEYLFSSYDAQTSTFVRFKTYFSRLHSLTYLKRNLIEFHSDIKRINFESNIINFNEDLQYLLDPNTFKSIAENGAESQPLLSFRANAFYSIMTEDKKFKKYIQDHIENIEAHLIRIYRIRNEIVHEAAIKPNIENLTSNLRYYLIYTISMLLDFFSTPSTEISIDDLISIDDFFIYKTLEYSNFLNSKNNQKDMFNNTYVENIVY